MIDLIVYVVLNLVSCNANFQTASRGLHPDKKGRLYLTLRSKISGKKFNIWLTTKSSQRFQKGDKPYRLLHLLYKSNSNGNLEIYLGLIEELERPIIDLCNQANLQNYNFQEFRKFIIDKLPKLRFPVNSEDQLKIIEEITNYCWIAKVHNYKLHWHINQFIGENKLWDEFKCIRSLNDHGHNNKILGIKPKYFSITCKLMNLDSDEGSPLESWESY